MRKWLDEMCELGVNSGIAVYSSLNDGLMREGIIDEGFRVRNEMLASEVYPNIIT